MTQQSQLLTIPGFIEHRWEEARETLRGRIDAGKFAALENEFTLHKVGLVAPSPLLASYRWPSLPSAWHRLLEGCVELALSWHSMNVALTLLEPHNDRIDSNASSGKQATYHFRSWFTFARASAENLKSIVNQWIELRIDNANEAKKLKRTFGDKLSAEFTSRVENQRNSYLHANQRSWATGITEDNLWEHGVFIRLNPEALLNGFVYPSQHERRSKDYQTLRSATQLIETRIDSLLRDLEAGVTKSQNPPS